jgi:hydrogenase expression/formation protein HypC
MKIISLSDAGQARVESGGIFTTISTALLEHVAIGDYVLVHAGFALERVKPDDARDTLAVWEELTSGEETRDHGG